MMNFMQKKSTLKFGCRLLLTSKLIIDIAIIVVSFSIPFRLDLYERCMHPQMIEDERIFEKTIYPSVMKISGLVNGFAGIILGAFLISVVRVISLRFGELWLGGYLLLSVPTCFVLIFCIALINTGLNVPEFNLFLVLIFLVYLMIANVANTIYIFYSLSDPIRRKDFFLWPNWYCSLAHLLGLIFVWYCILSATYITI